MKYDPLVLYILGALNVGTKKIHLKDFSVTTNKMIMQGQEAYLGFSTITECGRLLWLHLNQIDLPDEQEISPLMSRTFDAGFLYESYVIQLLELAGVKIISRQVEYIDYGLFKGHSDLVIDHDGPVVIDIKALNDKRAKEFQLTEKLAEAFEAYCVQVNLYMYHQNTKNGLLICYNKNNSDIYVRRVAYDERLIDLYIEKARRIITAKHWLDLPFDYTDYKPAGFLADDECATCAARRLCYGG